MAPKAADKKPAAKAPATASKAPEKKDAGKKTAASGDKKKRTKARKETYSSYIYKGESFSHLMTRHPPWIIASFFPLGRLGMQHANSDFETQSSSRSTPTLVSPTAPCPS